MITMGKRFFMRGAMVLALCASPAFFAGCDLYDDIVTLIGSIISSYETYDVSVIDCKVIPIQGDPITSDPNLSRRLSASIREGVDALGDMPKYQNVIRVDAVPGAVFPAFHDQFLVRATSDQQRREMLRGYCQQYRTNILLWGATMGDDYEIAFVCFLYRRDLDAIAATAPLKMQERMSERVQQQLVMDATMSLLQRSIDGAPLKGSGGQVVDTLRDNKELFIRLGELLFVTITT